ncbi:unnamed protein product [Miscanthus lutarioriparius]|uniref:1-deoxy-D-xylulose-5-phosphate reductoisomerase n=1 Tax=Miscanthus lutarioriparius TaxID=422564 RepID=A0A811P1F4_9POAL|nr:unnamed protein product [Miscanthus lutarioriparius]
MATLKASFRGAQRRLLPRLQQGTFRPAQSGFYVSKEGQTSYFTEKDMLFHATGSTTSMAWASCCRAWPEVMGWPKAYLDCWINWFHRNTGFKSSQHVAHNNLFDVNRHLLHLPYDKLIALIFHLLHNAKTLDIVAENPDKFRVVALAAGSNVTLLADQVKTFKPKLVAVRNESLVDELKEALADCDEKPEIIPGEQGVIEVARHPDAVTVVTGIVGCAGLKPTVAAIEAGKDIALANKETLIAGGPFVLPLAHKHKVKILPADSEHSAIFQDWPVDRLKDVKVADALKHPNWNMGKKITVDSATLFNKGLEVIEAHYLFGAEYDDIEIVIHPQSIIHSMVETQDSSVLAQLGWPDMRIPILYTLSWPDRIYCSEVTWSPPGSLQYGIVLISYWYMMAILDRSVRGEYSSSEDTKEESDLVEDGGTPPLDFDDPVDGMFTGNISEDEHNSQDHVPFIVRLRRMRKENIVQQETGNATNMDPLDFTPPDFKLFDEDNISSTKSAGGFGGATCSLDEIPEEEFHKLEDDAIKENESRKRKALVEEPSSGKLSVTLAYQPPPKRALKRPATLRSPYVDYTSKMDFKCTKDVCDVYDAVCAHASHDCGFHMLMHAEHWDGHTIYNFMEKDIPNIRKLLTHKWVTHPDNETNWRDKLKLGQVSYGNEQIKSEYIPYIS